MKRVVPFYLQDIRQVRAVASPVRAAVVDALEVMAPATIVQIAWVHFRHGKVDKMLWISLVLVVVFGGMTLIFQNEAFIKWKPTILYWVFAGSMEIKDPCFPDKPPYYAANSGDIISISNFPYSMLEMPVEISKDDAFLTFEARTEKIPALFSKVWLILEPVPEKK